MFENIIFGWTNSIVQKHCGWLSHIGHLSTVNNFVVFEYRLNYCKVTLLVIKLYWWVPYQTKIGMFCKFLLVIQTYNFCNVVIYFDKKNWISVFSTNRSFTSINYIKSHSVSIVIHGYHNAISKINELRNFDATRCSKNR